MVSDSINADLVRGSLVRLADHASVELLSKQPHWGDAILCDDLLAASDALKDDAPGAAAHEWFARKLATGPRLDGWLLQIRTRQVGDG